MLKLIARRTFAAVVETLFIAALSTVFSYFIATSLWFFGTSERINAYEWLLAFGFMFSLLGSFSKGWMPTRGKHWAKLHLVSIPPRRLLRIRIVARLLLIYVAAAALAYGSDKVVAVSALQDTAARNLLVPISILATIIATLFLPVSIAVGRGYQGLHDRITGLAISPTQQSEPIPTLSLQTHLGRTFIATMLLSIPLTALTTAVMLRMAFNPTSTIDQIAQDPALQRMDQILSPRSSACVGSSIDGVEARKFWVNLRCGKADGESTANFGVNLSSHAGKVLAYGFEIERTFEPTHLVSLKRTDDSVLKVGARVINAYIFLDSTAYHSLEVRNRLAAHVTERLLHGGLGQEFNAARVKFVRFTTVAAVSVGLEDVYYLMDGQVWRDSSTLDIPTIFRYSDFYPPPRAYITAFELR